MDQGHACPGTACPLTHHSPSPALLWGLTAVGLSPAPRSTGFQLHLANAEIWKAWRSTPGYLCSRFAWGGVWGVCFWQGPGLLMASAYHICPLQTQAPPSGLTPRIWSHQLCGSLFLVTPQWHFGSSYFSVKQFPGLKPLCFKYIDFSGFLGWMLTYRNQAVDKAES